MSHSRALVLCTMFAAALAAGCAHPYVRPKPPVHPINTSIGTEAEEKTVFEVRVIPRTCFAPCHIVATLTVQEPGEKFYCPGLRWDTGDGSKSESESDCSPYDQVDHPKNDRRIFSYRYEYRAGSSQPFEFRVTMFKGDKDLKSVSTTVNVTPRFGPDGSEQPN